MMSVARPSSSSPVFTNLKIQLTRPLRRQTIDARNIPSGANTPSLEPVPSLSLRPFQLRAVGAHSVSMLAGAAGLSRHYAELRIPLAIIAGTADQIVDVGQSKRSHNDIPDSALHLVEGTGPMAHYLNALLIAAATGESGERIMP
jgi:pimeloyl-ACP methyl ester carboxylesterase